MGIFFNEADNAGLQPDELDLLTDRDGDGLADPDEQDAAELDGLMAAATKVEEMCREDALDQLDFFDGGAQAASSFRESTEYVNEARRMSKNTYVRLNGNDDLTRRTNMACLMLAKKAHDPLFQKLANNRVMERKLRSQLFKKYGSKAARVAKLSQKQHIKDMRKMPALPKIKL